MRMTMNREVDLGKEPVKHLLFILAVPAITSHGGQCALQHGRQDVHRTHR